MAHPAPDGSQEEEGAETTDFFYYVSGTCTLLEWTQSEEAPECGLEPAAACCRRDDVFRGEGEVAEGGVEDGYPGCVGRKVEFPR
jgi:hypothetical protein